MNTAVHQEPYKLPAGILAVLVHAVFFAFLYFGLAWQTRPQAQSAMSVELWQNLPTARPVSVSPPPAPVVKQVEAPPEPVQEKVKPDIVLPEKKPKPEAAKPEPQPKPKPEPKSKAKPEQKPVKKLSAKEEAQLWTNAQPGRSSPSKSNAQTVQDAVSGKVVDEYTAKIASKIRSNIVMPPNVEPDAKAEFTVTLLPGGSVMNARLTKSSGNAAYDNAVERAILKSDPLPLPQDSGMFSRFRELKLSFRPDGKER
jgi:colicin import membrane protein